MTTSTQRQDRRSRRHRPRRRHRGEDRSREQSSTRTAEAPRPVPHPPGTCCPIATTEHRMLGGTVLRTRWHHPNCPVWTAR